MKPQNRGYAMKAVCSLSVVTVVAFLFLSSAPAEANPLDRLMNQLHFSVTPAVLETVGADLSAGRTGLLPFIEIMQVAMAHRLRELILPLPVMPKELPGQAGQGALLFTGYVPGGDTDVPGLFFADVTQRPPVDPPLEGKDREIQILPSLITFFCNPYALEANAVEECSSGLNLDTVEEIHLGIMGQIDRRVRVALFSTVSMYPFLGDTPFIDRKDFIQNRMTHRFSLLLAVSPAPNMYIGAAGGAQVVDSPRTYTFEVLLEVRIRR